MKIKLLIDVGAKRLGDVVEAIVPKNYAQSAYFYDDSDLLMSVFLPNYEIVYDQQVKPQALVLSIRELIGQDIKSMELK